MCVCVVCGVESVTLVISCIAVQHASYAKRQRRAIVGICPFVCLSVTHVTAVDARSRRYFACGGGVNGEKCEWRIC